MMKTKYILSAVLSAVIVCTTTSCMSQIAGQLVRQQMKDAASQLADAKDRKWSQINEKSYSSLLQNANLASGACFRITKGKGVTRDFVLPSEEFAQLKTILLHTGAVPQVEGGKALPVALSRSYKKKLLLTDASGKVIQTIHYTNKWMKETQMKQLSPERSAGLFEADWYLPDADYDALFSLPSLRAAESWAGQTH